VGEADNKENNDEQIGETNEEKVAALKRKIQKIEEEEGYIKKQISEIDTEWAKDGLGQQVATGAEGKELNDNGEDIGEEGRDAVMVKEPERVTRQERERERERAT
jgi:hypothetical protein